METITMDTQINNICYSWRKPLPAYNGEASLTIGEAIDENLIGISTDPDTGEQYAWCDVLHVDTHGQRVNEGGETVPECTVQARGAVRLGDEYEPETAEDYGDIQLYTLHWAVPDGDDLRETDCGTLLDAVAE